MRGVPQRAYTVSVPPAFSIYLDLIRVLCGIAVVFYHYSNHIIRASPRVFPHVGQEAVMVFFVLSGFVIAHVARRREHDPKIFVAKRLARVYPVAIAGVVLSYVLYAICEPLNPGVWEGHVSRHPWWNEVGLTLSFLNQSYWFPYAMPPANGPYWSLTCEFWFYVLAAFMFFAPWRWALAALLFALPTLGPKVMLLFPIWLLGALAERFCDRPRVARAPAGVLAVVSLLLVGMLWASDARSEWRIASEVATSWRLGRVSDVGYYYAFATLVAVHFFAAYNFFASLPFRWPAVLRVGVQHAAQTSFSLYAMHFPILFALRSSLPDEPFLYFFPTVTVALVLVFGRPIENLRVPAYRFFHALAGRTWLEAVPYRRAA